MNIIKILIAFSALCVFGVLYAATIEQTSTFTIGYMEISGDVRYEEKRAYARIRVKPHDRPIAGAELAILGSRIPGRALKMKFEMMRAESGNANEMVEQIGRMKNESGVQFFLVDADADVLRSVTNATAGMHVRLFNISEFSDSLRGADCQLHLMHVIPSYAMLSDALTQFLVSKKWRDILLLEGPEPDDRAFAAAFIRSAKRFGVEVSAVRKFVPGNDPRQREENNIILMTSDSDADVVFISDIEGEFGRYVPYRTKNPTPVIGTEGLQAASWHWAWERHGAPQLNQRFERHSNRHMQGSDWAAWAAVKSIIESILRTRSSDFKTIETYLRSDRLNLDAYKGTPVSYRSWDNQLRQPVLLHTYNAIADRAPIRGFLHPTENMDTLGYDQGDRLCQFRG